MEQVIQAFDRAKEKFVVVAGLGEHRLKRNRTAGRLCGEARVDEEFRVTDDLTVRMAGIAGASRYDPDLAGHGRMENSAGTFQFGFEAIYPAIQVNDNGVAVTGDGPSRFRGDVLILDEELDPGPAGGGEYSRPRPGAFFGQALVRRICKSFGHFGSELALETG